MDDSRRRAGGKPIAKSNLYNMPTNMIYTGKVKFGGTVYEGELERIMRQTRLLSASCCFPRQCHPACAWQPGPAPPSTSTCNTGSTWWCKTNGLTRLAATTWEQRTSRPKGC